MLSNISWHSYWTFLAILSGIYYITILFIYYRQDLTTRLLKKGLPAAGVPASMPVDPVTPDVHVVQSTLFDEDLAPDFEAPPADSVEYPVYACMDELNAFFEEAKASKWHKFELLHSLKQIFLLPLQTIHGSIQPMFVFTWL